jgi:hypothetical protein
LNRLLIILTVSFLCGPGAARVDYNIYADIPNDSVFADSTVRFTAERLVELIGPLDIDSLDIFIVASHKAFDSLAGSSIPDWGVGVAVPFRHRIVIKSPLITVGDKSLGELTAHEFSHIALSRAVGYRRVPRWLDEGLAMYVSAEWGWSDNLAMSWAVVLGSVIPLSQIEQLNRFEGERVRVAYSQSYLAFKYLLDTYGRSGLNILIDQIRSGKAIDQAFIAAIGADLEAFEREFTGYLNRRYNLLTLIFDSNLLWIILALVVVLGFLIVRFNRKRRISRLDEYDKLHSTDFDYGEVEEPDEDKPWD